MPLGYPGLNVGLHLVAVLLVLVAIVAIRFVSL
jgi:hypothetical protein